MHMCATNLCVWFMSIVVETLHAIEHGEHGEHEYHGNQNITNGGNLHNNGSSLETVTEAHGTSRHLLAGTYPLTTLMLLLFG